MRPRVAAAVGVLFADLDAASRSGLDVAVRRGETVGGAAKLSEDGSIREDVLSTEGQPCVSPYGQSGVASRRAPTPGAPDAS